MSVEKALEDIRNGKIVLVYDFDDRERETDMAIASEFITHEALRTMRHDAGGLVCTTTPYALAKAIGLPFMSDVFYDDANSGMEWSKMGVLGVEMESAALYCNAARAGKKALCICTVSDSFVYPEENTTAEERQNSFTAMMKIALELA